MKTDKRNNLGFISDYELEAFKIFIRGGNIPLKYLICFGISALFDPIRSVIINMPGGLGYKLRQIYYTYKFKRLGKNTLIDQYVTIRGHKNISIGNYTWIDSYTTLDAAMGYINIGKRIHIAQGCILTGAGGLEIQDYVGISAGAKIYSGSERPERGKRMSGPMIPDEYKGYVRKPVILEKDVFVGANSIILPGVKVGEGAVIGANSLVHKDVAPYSIVLGTPVKVIGKREESVMPEL